MAKFYLTPIGTLVHPWINTPDTKYNTNGLYHVDVDASGPEAENLAKIIEAASLAHLQQFIEAKKMKPGEAKKWSVYLPFERLEDDDGNPTGVIRFNLKQNAKIPSKAPDAVDGFKEVKIEIRDSANNIIDVPVFHGSEGRAMFTMRGVEAAATQKAGVRLDLAKVQITKLVSGGVRDAGFDVVEGGYVSGANPDTAMGDFPADVEDEGGDY